MLAPKEANLCWQKYRNDKEKTKQKTELKADTKSDPKLASKPESPEKK